MYKEQTGMFAAARSKNPNAGTEWLHYFKSSELFQVPVAILNSQQFEPHYLYSSSNIVKTINSMSIQLVRCVASWRQFRQLQSFSRET
jgi:hypothetical protein